jgi:hypothetical protein
MFASVGDQIESRPLKKEVVSVSCQFSVGETAGSAFGVVWVTMDDYKSVVEPTSGKLPSAARTDSPARTKHPCRGRLGATSRSRGEPRSYFH